MFVITEQDILAPVVQQGALRVRVVRRVIEEQVSSVQFSKVDVGH